MCLSYQLWTLLRVSGKKGKQVSEWQLTPVKAGHWKKHAFLETAWEIFPLSMLFSCGDLSQNRKSHIHAAPLFCDLFDSLLSSHIRYSIRGNSAHTSSQMIWLHTRPSDTSEKGSKSKLSISRGSYPKDTLSLIDCSTEIVTFSPQLSTTTSFFCQNWTWQGMIQCHKRSVTIDILAMQIFTQSTHSAFWGIRWSTKCNDGGCTVTNIPSFMLVCPL